MGTQPLFKLAVGICLLGAVSAQYPQNSLYRGHEKEHGGFRPNYFGSPQYPQQQRAQSTTPAPEDKAKFAKIMKQINKVNDDGSYTFGFENDDGSFRVETRSKDGLVKGKYGFIDGNGQLKVTEYTAGEKSDEPERDESESDEEGGEFKQGRPAGPGPRPLPLSARPQPQAPRPYYSQPQSLASRSIPYSASPSPYRIGARSHAFDQAPAAQTTNNKVSRAPPTSDDDFNESSEDEANAFANRQSDGAGAPQEDPLNNQYFRQSVTPSGGSPAGAARGRFPGAGGGISAAGRPIPGPYSTGAPAAYAQQYPGAYTPAQFNGFQGGPGGPQGFPQQGGPQGFQGAPQFGGPGQFVGSPQDFGGFPQGGPPQGFRRQAPQTFGSIGNPQAGASPQAGRGQSIQNFGGFGGFNARQGPGAGKDGSNQIPADEAYVPSVELDGYSEDLDEDGYPDEPPKDGKVKSGASGASSPNFRGSPGILQGGVQPGGAAPARGNPQVILQIGPQGQVLGGPTAVGAGRFQGQQGPTGFQGAGGPYYSPQQGFGGFPQGGAQGFPQQGAAQGFPQGFPQGFEGQGGFQGFPQQYPQQGAGGRGAQFQGGPTGPTGSPIQSEGFPYDFSPFGGAPSGPQGFPASAGAPGGFPIQQGNFPSSAEGSVQNFGGFPGSAGGPQGFPVGGGRFAGAGGGAQGAPGGAQSFVGGGVFPAGLGGQASPSAGGGAPSSSSEQKKA